jgi:acyl carrier protein
MSEGAQSREIEQEVAGIIAEEMRLDPGRVRPDSRLAEDLGAGSLHLIELAFSLEEKYGVSLPEGTEETVKTVSDVARLVSDELAKRERKT